MYEDLIKKLRNNSSGFVSGDTVRKAADAIEDLEGKHFMIKKTAEWLAERVPKWIPVTERLPEKPENYPHCELRECYFLVTLESTAVVSCGYDFENNRWREFFKVTHWMPLPKPPAVDTEEQP